MPRSYSEKFLISLPNLDTSRNGVRLAKLCVDANLPAVYIATLLGVTRMTMYSWFRGKPTRDKNSQVIDELIMLINKGIEDNVLPATDMYGAWEYLNSVSPRIKQYKSQL